MVMIAQFSYRRDTNFRRKTKKSVSSVALICYTEKTTENTAMDLPRRLCAGDPITIAGNRNAL